MEYPSQDPAPAVWLIRVSEVFEAFLPEILSELSAKPLKRLGRGFHLIRTEQAPFIRESSAAPFVRWNLPVHHSWPCQPKEVPGFVEKAAQAIHRKFSGLPLQTLVTGPLDPGATDRYYRTLASNLRGRALQLFDPALSSIKQAEEQDPEKTTLFCLLGREGLFCGVQSPRESRGFFPGGTKFIRQSGPGTISRAGAKIAEALHFLQLLRPPPDVGAHWLELGASPGGMTSELLARGYQVTAVDRAPLDPRLDNSPGLRRVVADAATFQPETGVLYDAILCDMNGGAMEAMEHVLRLSRSLKKDAVVVFTLKMPGVNRFAEATALESAVNRQAAAAGLRVFGATHLTYNRHELTMFLQPF